MSIVRRSRGIAGCLIALLGVGLSTNQIAAQPQLSIPAALPRVASVEPADDDGFTYAVTPVAQGSTLINVRITNASSHGRTIFIRYLSSSGTLRTVDETNAVDVRGLLVSCTSCPVDTGMFLRAHETWTDRYDLGWHFPFVHGHTYSISGEFVFGVNDAGRFGEIRTVRRELGLEMRPITIDY